MRTRCPSGLISHDVKSMLIVRSFQSVFKLKGTILKFSIITQEVGVTQMVKIDLKPFVGLCKTNLRLVVLGYQFLSTGSLGSRDTKKGNKRMEMSSDQPLGKITSHHLHY